MPVEHDATETSVLAEYRSLLRNEVAETVRYQAAWATRFRTNRVAYGCEFPRVVSGVQFRHACERASLVTYYLAASGRLAFGGSFDRLARFLRLSPEERDFFGEFFSDDVDAPLARPDMLLWDDHAAVLEANICSSIGGYSHEHLRAYLAEHPVWAKVAEGRRIRIPSPYDGVATLLRRRQPGRIGMIDVPDVEGIEPDPEGRNMKRFLGDRGIRIAYRCKEAPRFTRDGRGRVRGVTVAGRGVDALYRKFRGTFLWQSKALAPLREAIRRGAVRLLFSPLDRLFADKQLLALLSDPRRNGFVPPAHRAVVQAAVPWTRLVRSTRCELDGEEHSMVSLLEMRQKELVLKKGEGAGSDAVVIGAIASAAVWKKAIQRARREQSWIVQKLVMRPIRRVPAIVEGRLVDYVNIPVDCPFLIEGHSWGGLAKMSGYHALPGTRPAGQIRAIPVAAPIAILD